MSSELSRYQDPWTAEAYDAQIAGGWPNPDLPLYLAMAAESPGRVLELACGTGRVLLPLARQGATVTGLDISPHMLAVARRKLAAETPEVQAPVTLVEGDMSEFSLPNAYGLILIPYRAFQALLTRADQRGCLECCAKHLLPDGRLVINVFHPWLSKLPAQRSAEPDEYVGPDGETVKVVSRVQFDFAEQSLTSRISYEITSSAGEPRAHEHVLRLRYFFRLEMEWMLEACGFEVEALYGDFERSPFTAESPEMVFVARRRK
jgi:SAM-dependent methyltransferase